MSALAAHLAGKVTTIARAWAVTRRDGMVLGFTDHDRVLEFEGITFGASSGLTARAVEQSTGLAVDNSEALGALSDAAIREEDVRAGLYDGARLRAWLVNWANVAERRLIFRGRLGELERDGQAFRAELRGLSDLLNQPQGRVYQKPCAAVLGDGDCRFDLAQAGFSLEADVVSLGDGAFLLPGQPGIAEGWFERGRLAVLTGVAVGRTGVVKRDRETAAGRLIEPWEALGALAPGDRVRIEAGCDKRAETCRVKFANFLNFRGFPDIPGEDWLLSYPVSGARNDGGSLGG
ncbi:MAG: DUF2163 domain-containing protein [Silicimonas sp.]|nr:DUF2163 domain-containing protein [Silicimonas sp.]